MPKLKFLWSRRFLLGAISLGVLSVGFIYLGIFLQGSGLVDRYTDKVVRKFGRMVPEAGDVEQVGYTSIQTTLHDVEYAKFSIGTFANMGGAIDEFAGHLLFVTPSGLIGTVVHGARRNGPFSIAYLSAKVPMRFDLKDENVFYRDPLFNSNFVRVADILVDPVSDTEADLYVSHHQLAKTCIGFVVSRIRLAATADAVRAVGDGWDEVFRAKPCIEPKKQGNLFAGHQVGGRMVKPSSRILRLALGDMEIDGVSHPDMAPQDDSYDYGKIIEIDLATGDSHIFAKGLRNPQGLVQASDGTLWETEHGPKGGDEVNLIVRGRNYGWPKVTLGVLYGFPTRPWPPNPMQGRHDGFQEPKMAFVPSIATSAIVETNSEEFPLWKGDLLVATLKDEALWRLRRSGSEVIYAERLGSLGDRLRDAKQLSDGRIAMLTDSAKIILLRRKDGTKPAPPFAVAGYTAVRAVASARREEVATLPGYARPDLGKNVFNARCASCHNLRRENNVGPHLVGVVGRQIGAAEGFDYSDTLARHHDAWTKDKLIDFLADPDSDFAGTAMPRVELGEYMYGPLVEFLSTIN